MDPGPSEPGVEGAQATLEALAKTLHLDELEVSPGATLRRGTLSLPGTRGPASPRSSAERSQRSNAERSQRSSADGSSGPVKYGATLPRLEVGAPEDGSTADLELIRTLGEGGMGVVYLARQRTLSREVAVKRLKTEAGSTRGVGALLHEARATGALEHPSVVPVHALGADADGSPLLVMKRIEGDSLEVLVHDEAHPAWPPLERRHGDRITAIVEILMRVADALELAHARGIVHRDVKPENVMVGRFGEVYLVDWGIALRPAELDEDERTGMGIVGTPSFMAPEMVRGEAAAIDARTDVYLLGATLHAAITGTPRHEGQSLTSVLVAALVSQPRTYDEEIAELGALANRATSAAKDDRPESALAFRNALSDFLRHRSSMRLAREATARIDELVGRPPAELAAPEATRALTESRFALTQALREWTGNEAARAALDRALHLMIEAEVARRSPAAAEALASELSRPDPELAERLASLRAEVADARRLEEAARVEVKERDPRQSARQRAIISAGFIVLTVVIMVMGWRSEASGAGVRSMSEVLVYDAVLLGFAVVGVFVLRGRLLANRLGRQNVLTLLSLLVMGNVSDAIFWARGGDPREAGAFAMTAMASVLVGAGIALDRRFFVSGAVFVAGAVLCGIYPSLTIPSFGGAAIIATSVVLFDALKHARAPSA